MKAMFKPFIASFSALSLTACAGVNVSPSVTAFENGVIADVESICKVEPVAADIAQLIPIYGTNIAGAANAICAAVNAAPTTFAVMAPGSTGVAVKHGVNPVVVHGVTVHFQ